MRTLSYADGLARVCLLGAEVPVAAETVRDEGNMENSYLGAWPTADDPRRVQACYESNVDGLKGAVLGSGGDVTYTASVTKPSGHNHAVTTTRKKGEDKTKITLGHS